MEEKSPPTICEEFHFYHQCQQEAVTKCIHVLVSEFNAQLQHIIQYNIIYFLIIHSNHRTERIPARVPVVLGFLPLVCDVSDAAAVLTQFDHHVLDM